MKSVFVCEKCRLEQLHVINTEKSPKGFIRRRKVCLNCGHRISTYEFHKDDLKESGEKLIPSGIVTAIEIVNDQPKIGEWIPCSVRLPEKTGDYLCTAEWHSSEIVIKLHFFASTRYFTAGPSLEELKVIAWQPLPEPYKEV